MRHKKKILFITERRADFCRLKPFVAAIKESEQLELMTVVTGTHLLKKFGYTKNEILSSGFRIDAVLPIFHENDPDTGEAMARAFGKAIIGMADILRRLKPDIMVAPLD